VAATSSRGWRALTKRVRSFDRQLETMSGTCKQKRMDLLSVGFLRSSDSRLNGIEWAIPTIKFLLLRCPNVCNEGLERYSEVPTMKTSAFYNVPCQHLLAIPCLIAVIDPARYMVVVSN
jgi:hypothetical protein